MGHVVIGLAFGIVMLASALISGWGLGLALLIGWLAASLGIIATVALTATRLPSTVSTPVEDDPLEA